MFRYNVENNTGADSLCLNQDLQNERINRIKPVKMVQAKKCTFLTTFVCKMQILGFFLPKVTSNIVTKE
ncbi:hypothetical protein R83H12_01409 [Fibrobacteria bacterium R8-3-H12]